MLLFIVGAACFCVFCLFVIDRAVFFWRSPPTPPLVALSIGLWVFRLFILKSCADSANFVHSDAGWSSLVPAVVGAVWFCSLCFVIARAPCLLQRSPPLLVAFGRFVVVSTVHLGVSDGHVASLGLISANFRPDCSHMCLSLLFDHSERSLVVVCAPCLLLRPPRSLYRFRSVHRCAGFAGLLAVFSFSGRAGSLLHHEGAALCTALELRVCCVLLRGFPFCFWGAFVGSESESSDSYTRAILVPAHPAQ